MNKKLLISTLLCFFVFSFGMLALGEASNPLVASSTPTLQITIEEIIWMNPFAPVPVELPDGRLLLKVELVMLVSGDLTGTLTENVTQVWKPNPSGLRALTVLFKLETEEGVMEGYYSGHFREKGEQALIHAHGEVLSVDEAYVDYHQAKVDGQALLNLTTFDIDGTITIHPRNKS